MKKDPMRSLANAKNFSLTKEEKESMRGELMADIGLMREMFPKRFAGEGTKDFANLSTAELWQGRSKLLRHMRKNTQPVRERSTISVVTSFFQEMTRSLSPVFALFLVLAGVSTSVSAEQALPGDPLYPVKIYITEPIRGALHFFPKAQAEWDIKLLERRLQEAEHLATVEANSAYAQRVNQHLEEIAVEIQNSLDQQSSADAEQNIRGKVYSVMVQHQEAVRELTRNERERVHMRALIQKLEQGKQSSAQVGSFQERNVQFLNPGSAAQSSTSSETQSSMVTSPSTPNAPSRDSIINRTMRRLMRQSDDRRSTVTPE